MSNRVLAFAGTGLGLMISASACAAPAATEVSSALTSATSHSPREAKTPPPELRRLLALRSGDGIGANAGSDKGLAGLRKRAMEQEAKRQGSQTALHWRNKQIVAILDHYKGELDRAFNFGPLMLANGMVVPPVIQRVHDTSRRYDDQTMRTVQVGYRLTHPARVVTTPPTWRAFLITDYPKPKPAPNALLPKNSAEVALWKRAVQRGWTAGVSQANRNFKIDLNLLTSTYLGMLEYKVLRAKNMVSAPNLATTSLRITSHGRKLNIGDRIYRLTTSSKFKGQSGWKALPTAPRAGQPND